MFIMFRTPNFVDCYLKSAGKRKETRYLSFLLHMLDGMLVHYLYTMVKGEKKLNFGLLKCVAWKRKTPCALLYFCCGSADSWIIYVQTGIWHSAWGKWVQCCLACRVQNTPRAALKLGQLPVAIMTLHLPKAECRGLSLCLVIFPLLGAVVGRRRGGAQGWAVLSDWFLMLITESLLRTRFFF